MLEITVEGIFSENALSLTEVAKRRKVSTKSVFRWANHGVRGVVLDSVLVGGRRVTSVEALERFDQKLNAKRSIGKIDRGPTDNSRPPDVMELKRRAKEAIDAM